MARVPVQPRTPSLARRAHSSQLNRLNQACDTTPLVRRTKLVAALAMVGFLPVVLGCGSATSTGRVISFEDTSDLYAPMAQTAAASVRLHAARFEPAHVELLATLTNRLETPISVPLVGILFHINGLEYPLDKVGVNSSNLETIQLEPRATTTRTFRFHIGRLLEQPAQLVFRSIETSEGQTVVMRVNVPRAPDRDTSRRDEEK